MLKTIVAVLLALASPVGARADEDVCMLLMPIKLVNQTLSRLEHVISPPRVVLKTCGGGLDEEGIRIKPFPCLMQEWRASDTHAIIRTFFMRPDDKSGPWLLNSIEMCSPISGCIPMEGFDCQWSGAKKPRG